MNTNTTKKVLVINSSPNGEKGNTEILVNSFVEGLEAEGASIKRLYTKNLKIGSCCGKVHCWTTHPGVCAKKDDMTMVLREMQEADILVLASPVYVDGMTGSMKNLLERCLPKSYPYISFRDGHCRHNRRTHHGYKQLVLISNCGFHEMDNFDSLLHHIKAICRNRGCEFAGALLRPHGPALPVLLNKIPAKVPLHQRALNVLTSAERAGRELVSSGKMSDEALAGVSRELISRKGYQMLVNGHFGFEVAKTYVTKATKALREITTPKLATNSERKIPTPLVAK